MRTLESLKNLAVKLGCGDKSIDVVGDTVDEVIEYISDNIKFEGKPIELNLNINLTAEDLIAKAVLAGDIGSVEEGHKIFNAIDSSNIKSGNTLGLPTKQAIITLNLSVAGTPMTLITKGLPYYHEDMASGYNFLAGGFLSSTTYAFVQGCAYINSDGDTVKGNFYITNNLTGGGQ